MISLVIEKNCRLVVLARKINNLKKTKHRGTCERSRVSGCRLSPPQPEMCLRSQAKLPGVFLRYAVNPVLGNGLCEPRVFIGLEKFAI